MTESPFKGKNLLIVDDTELNLQLAEDIFDYEGFIVNCANNGDTAIDLATNIQFDAILMDIQMPGMNGLDTTKIIRGLNKHNASVPIFAMTGNAEAKDVEASHQAGMNGHFVKPLDPDLILEKLSGTFKQAILNAKPFELPEGMPPQLLDIEGYDFPSALGRLRNNWKLLKPICLSFCEKYVNAVDEIEKLQNDNSWDEAKRLAHTIKGTGASIGAMDISAAAAVIETSAGDQAVLPEAMDTLRTVLAGLNDVKAIINTATHSTNNAAITEFKQQDFEERVIKLPSLATTNVADVKKILDELNELCKNSQESSFIQELLSYYNNFKLADLKSAAEQKINTF